MDVQTSLLNRVIDCHCGQTHFVPIEKVRVGNGVASDLKEFLSVKQFQSVLMVSDANTYQVFGAQLCEVIANAGFRVSTHTFAEGHDLLPDEAAVQAVESKMAGPSFDVLVSVGSGVITDIVRYVAYEHDLPFISVATAPSMDGYASGMAAMQFHGIKITSAARPPIAIFAELNVLTEAPFELIQSGFGDLAGKVTSLSDWTLSSALYGEHFCQVAYDMVYEPLQYVLHHPSELFEHNREVVKNLFVGLVNAGIAMAMVGNSRPCSGCEHHCSHYWDLLAYKGERPHTSHGLQVGYATHFVVSLYQYAVKHVLGRDDLSSSHLQVDSVFLQYAKGFYGKGASDIIQSQQEKAIWLLEHNNRFSGASQAHLLDRLEPTLSLQNVVSDALVTMGIPSNVGCLGIDEDHLRETLLHARELRSRYTILDFLAQQGELERAVDTLLASL